MKILFIVSTKFNPNSGVFGATFSLAQQYQKLGHEVCYYTLDNLPLGLPGIVKLVLFPWFAAFHILKLSRQNLIDVVDSAASDAWVWAKIRQIFTDNYPLLVMRSHGLEQTLHLHNLEEVQNRDLSLSWKYWLYRGSIRLWQEAFTLHNSDLVFLLNHRDWKYAIEHLAAKPEQVKVVTNGIPEKFLSLTFRPMSESENLKIGIAQVGTYISRKGITYSVAALNAILARYPQVEVSFLGTGCSETDVHRDFAPNLRDRIKVVPHYAHDNLPTLLKDHHIKLFPTLYEGFSLVLVEAMACGLVAVTTATPGSMEILKDGHNGILIPIRDSRAIEQALEKLITDRSTLENLRCHAYTTAQNYSWQNIAQDQLSLYEKAI